MGKGKPRTGTKTKVQTREAVTSQTVRNLIFKTMTMTKKYYLIVHPSVHPFVRAVCVCVCARFPKDAAVDKEGIRERERERMAP